MEPAMYRTETAFHHVRPGTDLSLLGRIARRVRRWRELSQQRAALASLDDATLRDIGISRAEARFEATRPFWDDPAG
jgi:uncharacterized protein YjiS (DUF1127 family)